MRQIITDAIIRAIRTFAQAALGVYLAGLATSPMLHDLSNWDLIQAALAAGIVAVLWNVLEGLGGAKYRRG
jgi:hypothetical protein